MADQQLVNKPIMVLILVLAFAIGYLYYSQSTQTAQTSMNPPPFSTNDELAAFKDLTINFSILDDTRFKSLKTFGESPVRPGVTGKRDIFAPF